MPNVLTWNSVPVAADRLRSLGALETGVALGTGLPLRGDTKIPE